MKTKTVDAEVDIDLDDFTTEELLDELCERLSDPYDGDFLSKSEIKRFAERIIPKLIGETPRVFPDFREDEHGIKLMADDMKMDFLKSIFHKYTLSQLELLLK